MHRQPRGLRGREKLQAIIEASRRIVLTEGLAQAKMSDIATEAKVSTATVYAYFPSKDALFHAVVEAVAKGVEARLDGQLYDLDGDPIEALAKAFLLRLNDHDVRAMFRIIAIEGDRFPEIRTLFDSCTRSRAHQAALELFEQLASQGRFEAGAAELASYQLMGMLEHETMILGVLKGDAYRQRDNGEIARDAAKTLWARFAVDAAVSA
jgi:AcrR family transcriptional regulator